MRDSLRVGVSMIPTTVFTLVIVEILRTSFEVPPHVRGGLVVYAIITTLTPSIWLRRPGPSFEAELELGLLPDGADPQLPEPTVERR